MLARELRLAMLLTPVEGGLGVMLSFLMLSFSLRALLSDTLTTLLRETFTPLGSVLQMLVKSLSLGEEEVEGVCRLESAPPLDTWSG